MLLAMGRTPEQARASLRLVLDSESSRKASLTLHAMSELRGGRAPSTGWVSRRFELKTGEAVEIAAPHTGERYAFRVRLAGSSGSVLSTVEPYHHARTFWRFPEHDQTTAGAVVVS